MTTKLSRINGNLILKAILAVDDTNGIGKDGKLPWPTIKEDMAFFRTMTSGHAVIMGRKTYQSLPPQFRPLPGRLNIVLSQSCPYDLVEGISAPAVVPNLHRALELLAPSAHPEAFIIGGASLYNDPQVIGALGEVYLTRVRGNHCCDTFAERLVSKLRTDFDVTWSRHVAEGSVEFQKWVRR
jgi:dihydrofolate reductase